MEIPFRGAARLVGADGRKRLDRSRMAEGIWRRRTFARGSKNPAKGNALARVPLAARLLRHLDARARTLEIRQRGAEARIFAADRSGQNPLVSGLFGAECRLGPSLACYQGGRQGWPLPGKRP